MSRLNRLVFLVSFLIAAGAAICFSRGAEALDGPGGDQAGTIMDLWTSANLGPIQFLSAAVAESELKQETKKEAATALTDLQQDLRGMIDKAKKDPAQVATISKEIQARQEKFGPKLKKLLPAADLQKIGLKTQEITMEVEALSSDPESFAKGIEGNLQLSDDQKTKMQAIIVPARKSITETAARLAAAKDPKERLTVLIEQSDKMIGTALHARGEIRKILTADQTRRMDDSLKMDAPVGDKGGPAAADK